MIDPAKFTDEGWWANAAVMHALTGHWHIAGDYNPAAALPMWPLMLGALFHFTGASIIAARALSAAFSFASLGVVYALVRRYAHNPIAAETAVLLMAASPFAFVFSRLATLDTLVVFEFCLMLLVASLAPNDTATGKPCIWPLAALALLVTAALLTKTTVAVLLPAVAWIAWTTPTVSSASNLKDREHGARSRHALIRAVVTVIVAPLAFLKLWALFISWTGYGQDYAYFFGVNDMPDIDWSQTLHWLHDLAVNGFWIDRFLYPLALAILLASLAFKRRLSNSRSKTNPRRPRLSNSQTKTDPWGLRLWRNPLFTASWLAIAGEAIFIFCRQDDYAPRYFLAMLAPMVFIVAVAFDDALRSSRTAAGVLATAMAIAVIFNSVSIAGFLAHRQYQFYGAARDIAATIRADRIHSQLLFGVSAAEVGLIAGLPSINAAYGIDDMAAKVARYKPGWYLAWNDENENDVLAGHKLVPVASYRIFDDDERTTLVLYEIQWTVNRE